MDFVGRGESTPDGQPLPVGAVVRAYDPIGVLAGQAEVALAGWYLVSVYGDDPMTTDLDEGAEAGDLIAFTVDGYPAVPLGPDPSVWTETGDRLHVELRACTLAGDFDCDCRVTVVDPSTGLRANPPTPIRSFNPPDHSRHTPGLRNLNLNLLKPLCRVLGRRLFQSDV